METEQERQWRKETVRQDGEVDSILLIGQSNMCGRGIIGQVPPIDPEGKMFMLRNGRWQPMSEPINPDRQVFAKSDVEFRSGVSLAASFAQEYAHAYDRKVGLIPCADGGTKLIEWQPGEILFDHAVMQAKLAQRSSKICGILWHQGESDSREPADVAAYAERFFCMLDAMVRALGLDETVPVIVGEITLLTGKRWPLAAEINGELHKIAASRPNMDIASAEGLTLSADGIHFDSASYRVFGRRYFEAYQRARRRVCKKENGQ